MSPNHFLTRIISSRRSPTQRRAFKISFRRATFPTVPLTISPSDPSTAPIEGTVSNFATVILERLADPMRPFDPRPALPPPDGDPNPNPNPNPNPDWNPYIPVDLQPVDLTVFRGESPTDDATDFYFYTRQRTLGQTCPTSTYGQ